MMKSAKKFYKTDGKDRFLPRVSLAVFDKSRTAAIIWLCLTVFGVFSYTTFLKREGFPSISVPYAMVNGTYFVNDPAKVDKQVSKPLTDIVLKDTRVKDVQSLSQGTFFNLAVQYKEGTDLSTATQDLRKAISSAQVLPKGADFKVEVPKFGLTERGDDAVIALYDTKGRSSQQQLVAAANTLVGDIKKAHIEGVDKVSVVSPFTSGKDPITGQAVSQQTRFDRYGFRTDDQNRFYDSVSVGITQQKGSDVIKLDDHLQQVVADYNKQSGHRYAAAVSGGYAHDIKEQIGELQRSLLEGLLAVLVIGSLVIAIRASIITVLAMVTVLALTLGVLFVTGYTLNTITLFSLILCLGLIVDDTIIMVEAIDAERRRRKNARETIQVATRKVSRAMVAATSTAALSFAPLLFVGGVLGSFIRAIPVTVITSLVVSLLVALIFIPLFARYLLLGKKQMGAENVHEIASAVESKIARFIGKPMLWAEGSRKKLMAVGLTAVVVGMLFIGAGGYIFTKKVSFNIFPPSKDSNGLSVAMTFPEGTTIEQAEAAADKANKVVARSLGDNFETAAYYAMGKQQTATMTVAIKPYGQRDITAPQLQDKLNNTFKHFSEAKVKVSQVDVGPPSSAFKVRIDATNRTQAVALAKDVNSFLQNRELTRPSGEKATITETAISDMGSYSRDNGKAYIDVSANFDATDTSTLVTLAQTAVKDHYTEQKLRSAFGMNKDAISFDIGQEEENQQSFAALALAFPALLFVIYLLLAVQFRSLAQPLLIFMALPFSLFGISVGLWTTDNPFSFFAMLGFFALIGLSIKNTILLTDFANQLRRDGANSVQAAVGALGERFRPLVATSLTAVVSLIPLAIASPFWEGLAVVLIFGLLSSTLLVILVFPYYYLGAEFIRLRITRKACLSWLVLSIAAIAGLVSAKAPVAIAPLVPVVMALLFVFVAFIRRKRRA
jgi:multidrug efflux pump subunit AcrB